MVDSSGSSRRQIRRNRESQSGQYGDAGSSCGQQWPYHERYPGIGHGETFVGEKARFVPLNIQALDAGIEIARQHAKKSGK